MYRCRTRYHRCGREEQQVNKYFTDRSMRKKYLRASKRTIYCYDSHLVIGCRMECCQFQKVRSAPRMISERAQNTLAFAIHSEFIRNGLAFATRSKLSSEFPKHLERAANLLKLLARHTAAASSTIDVDSMPILKDLTHQIYLSKYILSLITD